MGRWLTRGAHTFALDLGGNPNLNLDLNLNLIWNRKFNLSHIIPLQSICTPY